MKREEGGRASWAVRSILRVDALSEEGRAELPGPYMYVSNVRMNATSKGRASWAVAFHL